STTSWAPSSTSAATRPWPGSGTGPSAASQPGGWRGPITSARSRARPASSAPCSLGRSGSRSGATSPRAARSATRGRCAAISTPAAEPTARWPEPPSIIEGVAYLVIALSFGLATGIVGRVKGSSFFLWALIGTLLPALGLIAALLYRYERGEPE